MARPKKYPDELIVRGVRLALESGRPIAQVAKDLGMGAETLRRHVRQAQADSGDRPDLPTSAEREEIRTLRDENYELRRAKRDPQGRIGVFRQGARPAPIEVSAFIDAHREDFGVELICRTIGTSASAYYQRATGARSDRDVQDERLLGVIRRVLAENYEAYGSRRTWKAMRREGETAGRGRVERLMARNAIVGAKRRGKPWRTTIPGPEPVSVPDLLQRDFTASCPNEKWCADFTYLRCWTGVVFLSFVIDVYSRMIVGWQFAGHMRESLVEDALQMAVSTRRIDPQQVLIHHSDHGSQYTSRDFTAALGGHGIHASLGSVGDAYDNALAESFVDTLKTELLADRVWQSRGQLEFQIARWIGWYNQRRLHSSLGDIPPVEFEAVHAAQTSLAQAA